MRTLADLERWYHARKKQVFATLYEKHEVFTVARSKLTEANYQILQKILRIEEVRKVQEPIDYNAVGMNQKDICFQKPQEVAAINYYG